MATLRVIIRGNDYRIIKALYYTSLEYVRSWVQIPRTIEESKQENTMLGHMSIEKHRSVPPIIFASQIIYIQI